MKKTGALLLLMAAMLVAVPAYNTAFAAQRATGPDGQQQQQMMRGPHHGYGPGYNYGPGWQHPAIAPEKQAAYEKIMTEYHGKIQPLHNEMWSKNTELHYLSMNGKAESKEISKMVADMNSIRGKCQALNDTTATKLSKDLGISSEHAYSLLGRGGCGMGQGRGMGHGFGHDGPRGHWGGHR